MHKSTIHVLFAVFLAALAGTLPCSATAAYAQSNGSDGPTAHSAPQPVTVTPKSLYSVIGENPSNAANAKLLEELQADQSEMDKTRKALEKATKQRERYLRIWVMSSELSAKTTGFLQNLDCHINAAEMAYLDQLIERNNKALTLIRSSCSSERCQAMGRDIQQDIEHLKAAKRSAATQTRCN